MTRADRDKQSLRALVGVLACLIASLVLATALPADSSAREGSARLPDASPAPGLTSSDVRDIHCEGQKLFIGTWRGGLSVYDARSKTWEYLGRAHGLLSNHVTAVCVANGELWVGTDKGLCYFDGQARQWQYFGARNFFGDDCVTALLWDGRFVWVGTKRGLSRYDTRFRFWATTFKEHGVPSDYITCLARDPSRRGYRDIWIGTSKGLLAYDLKLTYLDVSEYKPREVTESQTWAIARYLRPTFDKYQLGPLANEIRDIVVQGEVAWIVSPFGISYFDRESMTRVFPPPWRSYVYDKEWDSWMAPMFYVPSLMTVGNIRNIQLAVADTFKSKYPYERTIVPEYAWDDEKRELKARLDEQKARAIEQAIREAKTPPIAEELTPEEQALMAHEMQRGRETKTFKRIPVFYLLDTFHRDYVRCAVPLDKDVWFLADDFLYSGRIAFEERDMAWKKKVPVTSKPQPPAVHCAAVDERGTVWVGTDQGVWAYSGKGKATQTFEAADVSVEAPEDTLPVKEVTVIDQDVWAVRSNNELVHYDHLNHAWTTEARLSGLPPGMKVSVVDFDGTIRAIAENGRSLVRALRGWQPATLYQDTSSVDLRSLTRDENELWFAAGRDVGRLARGKDRPVLYRLSQPVSFLCNLGQDLWAVGSGSLFQYDRRTDSFSEVNLPDIGPEITGLAGHGHRLWIGTPSGILEYDTRSGAHLLIRTENRPADLLDNEVRRLDITGDCLWITTRQGLSCREVGRNATYHFQFGIDLPTTPVHGVASDGDYTYLATGAGLVRFGHNTHRWDLFPVDERDGVVGLHDMAVGRAYVWGATHRGLYKFHKATGWWTKS